MLKELSLLEPLLLRVKFLQRSTNLPSTSTPFKKFCFYSNCLHLQVTGNGKDEVYNGVGLLKEALLERVDAVDVFMCFFNYYLAAP